jgi:hypothetical protein
MRLTVTVGRESPLCGGNHVLRETLSIFDDQIFARQFGQACFDQERKALGSLTTQRPILEAALHPFAGQFLACPRSLGGSTVFLG